ncbi:tyrosine tRNA ligase [Mycena leptocephala]|nr:tyrosine tRNA ligase [Mycena leptocephala]
MLTGCSDIHAFLDNMKAPLELVEYRTKYYKFVLTAVFKSLGIPTNKLKFSLGSDYQLSKEFNMDNYRLCATVTEHDAKKAGAEVALDEQYLGSIFSSAVSIQRKIFTFRGALPPTSRTTPKRAHLMNAMVPGLAGGKMSSSDPTLKLTSSRPEVVRKKIKPPSAKRATSQRTAFLAFLDAALIPISRLRLENAKKGGSILEPTGDLKPFASNDAPEGTVFSIERDEKFGGSTHYQSYEELRNDFAEKKLHPKDLKTAVANAINRLLDPIRQAFAEDEEAQKSRSWRTRIPTQKTRNRRRFPKVYHPPPPGKGKNAEATEEAKQQPPPA